MALYLAAVVWYNAQKLQYECGWVQHSLLTMRISLIELMSLMFMLM